MRYVVTSHGCHRKVEKIPLYNVRLLMYSYENEYVRYKPPYIETFCQKGYRKKNKAYKPLFGVSDAYYEMEFGKEEGDRFHSYVQCCKTGETIYDFANGDLLLSDVIELVRYHAQLHKYPGKINLSILTCNTPCKGKVPDVGTALHRSNSYKINLEPPTYNWNGTRAVSRAKRKKNMTRLANSQRMIVHVPKSGNTMIHKTTGEKIKVTKNTVHQASALKKTHYYLPNLVPGDFVYYGQTYLVNKIEEVKAEKKNTEAEKKNTEDMITYYEIRNEQTEEVVWVEQGEVLKVDVLIPYDPSIQVNDYVRYGKVYVIDEIGEEDRITYYKIRNLRNSREEFWIDARKVIKIEF